MDKILENNLDEIQLITFKLANDTFAVDIHQLREVCYIRPSTPVPNTPDFVTGVINLRGKIVPIIDLRKRFNLPEVEDIGESSKIIVSKLEGKLAGFTVDAVLDVLDLSPEDIETPSRALVGFEGKYIKGVVKLEESTIVLLDIEYILTSTEKIDLSNIIEHYGE